MMTYIVKVFAHPLGLLKNGLCHVITVPIHGRHYIGRKQIPWNTTNNYRKCHSRFWAWEEKRRDEINTGAVEGGVNGGGRFDVEEENGIFGILGDDVAEAPGECVHALLSLIDGHQYPPLLCCHVRHFQLLKRLIYQFVVDVSEWELCRHAMLIYSVC